VAERSGGEGELAEHPGQRLVGPEVGLGRSRPLRRLFRRLPFHQMGDDRRLNVVADRIDDGDVEHVGVERVVEAVACYLVWGTAESCGNGSVRGISCADRSPELSVTFVTTNF